ncbi:MAG: sodium-dependent transporter [Bacteroidales bacterium]|nr:sodium-dependent transporter [Candidatus Cryptobacteroides faecihippi]MCQ2162390.1 sodium-dependent transporter [Bacteroidales bacterium]
MSNRENFGSRTAVIMAMAGSAIGLGNIWRFPYVVGEYGGAAFVLAFIVCCIFISIPILLSEAVIGRRSQQNTFGAMETLAPGTKWKWVGLLTVITPIIIVSYYSVVGGWSIDYLLKSLSFQFRPEDADKVSGMFGQFASSVWAPAICHFVFIGLCALIVFLGVKDGIEKFSKTTMPILFVLIVLIAVYSITLPGSGEGVRYLLKPDFSKLTSKAWAAALGQSFFSLSLGVGTMLTYSSYVSKKEDIVLSGAGTAFSDLLFALLAGFAIMPAVFAAGIAPGAGPGLVFETLPYIFAKMGAGARVASAIVAILFFLTILVAALSSAISMMEVGVAYLSEEKGVSRGKATLGIFIFAALLGLLCSLSFGPLSDVHLLGNSIFDFCDKLCSNYLMMVGALLFSLFVGWKMKKEDVIDELSTYGTIKGRRFLNNAIYYLIKYMAPVAIILIFLLGLMD